MDNGEVIPGLNENWTFAGANAMEWMSGFVVFIMSTEMFDKISRSMPLLIIIWLATTFFLASMRRMFPDEERGLRNFLMVKVGLTPMNLPDPSELQPLWAGTPMHSLRQGAHFNTLDLDGMLAAKIEVKQVDELAYSRGQAGKK